MILSADPGDTTGYVVWDEFGKDMYHGQLPSDEFINRLTPDRFPGLTHIIYEDFRLFRGRAQAQTGSRFKASQVIGALKMLGSLTKAKMVCQETQHRDLGYKYSDTKAPSNHAQSHWTDAYAHGYYWFVRQGILITQQQARRYQSGEALPK